MKLNSYFIAFVLVFLAGLSWSFGAVVVRHMENAKDENRPKSFTKSNLIQLTQKIAEYRSALINNDINTWPVNICR